MLNEYPYYYVMRLLEGEAPQYYRGGNVDPWSVRKGDAFRFAFPRHALRVYINGAMGLDGDELLGLHVWIVDAPNIERLLV